MTYSVPKATPRIVIGTPTKAFIGGWCSGNPAAAGWAGEVVQAQCRVLVDGHAEQALADGQMADEPDDVVIHAGVHEGEQRRSPGRAQPVRRNAPG